MSLQDPPRYTYLAKPAARTPKGKSRAGRRVTTYRARERHVDYMLWVKTLPCSMRADGRCSGVVEADHAGGRAMGRKAHDSTCIPLCTGHHRARSDGYGPWWTMGKEARREWLREAIARTHSAARAAGVTIPEGASGDIGAP